MDTEAGSEVLRADRVLVLPWVTSLNVTPIETLQPHCTSHSVCKRQIGHKMPIILHLRHKSKTYYKQVYFGRFFQNSKSLTLAHILLYELQYQTRGSWSYCQQQKQYRRKSKFFKESLLYIYIVGICLINKGENVTKNSR